MLFSRTTIMAAVTFCLITIPARTQTVEVTDEFKQVIKELAREEFRTYVFNVLKEKDPVIAASTYDLIERVVAGDTVTLIANQVVLSLLDYSMFIEFESKLEKSIPMERVIDKNGTVVSPAEYTRLIKIGVLLMYERIARDNYLIVSGAVRQMLADETYFVSSHAVKNSSGQMKFGMAVYLFMSENDSALTSLLEFKQMLKNIVSIAVTQDTAALNMLRPKYQTMVKKEFESAQAMLRDALTPLKASLDTIYFAYDALKEVKYAHIFRDLAPYVYNIVYQRVERLPIDFNRETVRAVITKLSAIQNEDKTGIKYKVGLWMGIFFDGSAWNPPSSNDFILSLRLNDRLQYTFDHGFNHEWFAYVGGFVDAALKELSNKTANEFVFAGVGYSYKSVALTVSGFIPIDAAGKRNGIVVTAMYDLPLEKIINIF